MLTSYIFKPEHGHEIATKIIERFCNDFLYYSHEGFYLNWRTSGPSGHGRQNLPEGYIEFWIETENGNMEAWTETCFNEEPLTAHDLTDGLFVLLGEDFWHEDDSGKTMYTFEERELCEIINHLAEDDTRVIALGSGKEAFVSYQSSARGRGFKTIDTSDFLFNVHIEGEDVFDNRQLTLPLV